MQEHQAAFEVAAAASASKAMYTGAGSAIAGFVISNEVLGVLGLLIALAGFFVNTYYRRKQDARDEIEHLRRMRAGQTEKGELDK